MQNSKEGTRLKPVPNLPEVREGRAWSTVSNQSTSMISMKSQPVPVSRRLKRQESQMRLKWNSASQTNLAGGSQYSSTDAGNDESHKRRESLYFGKHVRTAMWWLYRRPEELAAARSEDTTITEENTYQIKPKSRCRFSTTKVEEILHDAMRTHGDFLKLKIAEGAGDFIQFLATNIKERIKALEFDRYRLIVHVQMGSSMKQDLMIASRCIWNVETDTFANVTFRMGDSVVVITVYGIYLD